MKEISFEIARKNADPNCVECGGTGWTWSGTHDDRVEVYCLCAKDKMVVINEPEQTND